jgi:hypothetical protein
VAAFDPYQPPTVIEIWLPYSILLPSDHMQSEVEMSYPNRQTELAEVFRSLGASDPDQWAYSEVHEGIPQLHRYFFCVKHGSKSFQMTTPIREADVMRISSDPKPNG